MKRFSNILLVVETDTDNDVALRRAVALAKDNQAALTVCAVVDAVPSELQLAITSVTPQELLDIAVTEEYDKLDKIVTLIAEGNIAVESKVLVGKPFIEIIRQVLHADYDLVMKCPERVPSLIEVLFGSIDMHLMRKCPCPVWIMKPTEHSQYRRILAAIDKDPENAVKDALNRQILEMSTSLALAEFSELHVVHAWRLLGENTFQSPRMAFSDAEVDDMIAQEGDSRRLWVEQIVSAYGVTAGEGALEYLKPQLHVIKGDARVVVPSLARQLDVDLIVMGTVARTGVAGFFMGNTAESILASINCSVLAVKPPGFITPVKPKD